MKSNSSILRCTRDFVTRLSRNNELWVLDDLVDPDLELAQLQREVCERRGPAILFSRVKGTRFPVVTNLYGSERRIELAFGKIPSNFVRDLSEMALNFLPPNREKVWDARKIAWKILNVGLKSGLRGPVLQNELHPVDLTELPQIKSWPKDGGPFITFPLVYTESPISGKGNLGMYRVQIFNATQAGMHIQLNRGGGFHYFEAEQQGRELEARVFIGGPPAMTIAAIAPLPEDIPELLFASLLLGKKLTVKRFRELKPLMVLDSDFSLNGRILPHVRKPEGPFGDHYGYYSLCHDYPFMETRSINYRNDAIFPATVVGRPPQEDHFIAEYLQEILEPLFPLVLKNVKKVWAYEESGVHSLAVAVVKNRYYKEAFTAALRILSEGQLSLTKFLMVTDRDCDVRDFKSFFVNILERTDFKRDLYVLSDISQDTLDYTGPKVNKGSKAILMGIGEKKRELSTRWEGTLHLPLFEEALLFCPGVLCVKGVNYRYKKNLAEELLKEPDIAPFSLVILLDDPKEACASDTDFIWHVFTRFEPASDMFGEVLINRFHVGISGPVVIDCRMKTWYPEVLEEDPGVARAVLQKWGGKIDRVCRM